MPDITMCTGTDCPLKENCYRYKAKATPHWQSYWQVPPYRDGECKYQWKLEVVQKGDSE